MLYGVRARRLTQIGNHRERQYRQYITHRYLPLMVTNRLARKEIVRVLERKRFW
jgi:ribosomal protein S2